MNKPWYQRPGWIIALLVLFFPAGLFLMWRYSAWELRTKRLVTGLLVWPVGALFLTRHTAWPRWTKGLAWGAAAIWVIFALAFAVAPFSNGATDDGNLVQSATSEEPSEDSTGEQTVEVATEMENAEEPKTAPTSEPTIEVTPNPQPVVTPAATPTL